MSSFRVSERALEIVETLKEVLECTVLLHDADEGRMHLYRGAGDWMSFKSAGIVDETPPRGCRIDQPIGDRWWLHVAKKGSLHPDARRLAPWAATALVKELPGGRQSAPSFPPRGGGAGGNSAELGIPVSWARRSRG